MPKPQMLKRFQHTCSSMLAVQSFSHVLLFVTPWTAARQAPPSFTNSRSLFKLMCVKSVMPFNYLPSRPLSSPSPSTFNLSQHQGFFLMSALCIRWSKYWTFSFSIGPSNEYSGLISFRIDWFDLLAVSQ